MKSKFITFAALMGAVAAVASSLLFIVLELIGGKPLMNHELMFMPLFAIAFIAGLWYYRFNMNAGKLAGYTAMTMALIANFVASAVYVLFIWVYLGSIHPESKEKYRKDYVQMLIDNIEEQILVEQDSARKAMMEKGPLDLEDLKAGRDYYVQLKEADTKEKLAVLVNEITPDNPRLKNWPENYIQHLRNTFSRFQEFTAFNIAQEKLLKVSIAGFIIAFFAALGLKHKNRS